MLKVTAIDNLQPCHFFNFDREIVTNAYSLIDVYSFQKNKSLKKKKWGQDTAMSNEVTELFLLNSQWGCTGVSGVC